MYGRRYYGRSYGYNPAAEQQIQFSSSNQLRRQHKCGKAQNVTKRLSMYAADEPKRYHLTRKQHHMSHEII